MPALYEVEYNEDGTIRCMKPKYDDIPVKIKKQVQVDLTNSTYRRRRLCLLSRRRRIEWCLKYSVAV